MVVWNRTMNDIDWFRLLGKKHPMIVGFPEKHKNKDKLSIGAVNWSLSDVLILNKNVYFSLTNSGVGSASSGARIAPEGSTL